MDTAHLLETLKEFLRKNLLIAGLGALGLILLGTGAIQLAGSSKQTDVQFVKGSESQKSDASGSAQIFVDISGAVLHPGVYKLASDSRVQDAIIVAGGLSENANRDFVAKNLNLAQKLPDGAKIYIPSAGQTASGSTLGTSSNVLGSQTSGLISINTASAGELDSLPGIGAVTAQKIIDGRPYASLDELVTRKIVSQKVFDKMKEKISLY